MVVKSFLLLLKPNVILAVAIDFYPVVAVVFIALDVVIVAPVVYGGSDVVVAAVIVIRALFAGIGCFT